MINQMSLAERWVAQWPLYKGWFVAAIIAAIITLFVTWLALRNIPRGQTKARSWVHTARWTVLVVIALILGLNLFNALSVNLSDRREPDRSGIEAQKEALEKRLDTK